MEAGTTERVAQLFATGAAIVVATADARGRTALTRGWGAAVLPDEYVSLCVSAPGGSAVRTNLAANSRIAVTVVDPTTYASVQVKGVVDLVRTPTPAEHGLVDTHVRRFCDAVASVGLVDADCMMLGGLVAVSFVVTEVYDQTPGTAAGQALA